VIRQKPLWAKSMKKGNEKNEVEESWAALWREALAAMSLGWDLAVPIFGGTLLGYYLDRWLDTGHIFTIGLLFLGIAVGFHNVARFIRRLEAHEKRIAREEKEDQTE